MPTTKIEDHIHLIDAETAGIKNFIASYVLRGKQAAIVETGPTSSIPNVLSGLKELRVKPEDVAFVAVSHIHLDHGGGAGTLIKHLPEAKVIVHPRGAPHLVNPEKLWQQSKEVLGRIADLYGEPEPVPTDRIAPATDDQVLDLGNGVRLQALETLGHASHHLSYCEMLSGGVFPGDAAGIYLNEAGVVVPTTPPPFRMDVALASLSRLIAVKPKALFYSHFGRASGAAEKLDAYARQLELWAGIARRGIQDGDDLEAISRKIAEGDKAIRKALEQISVHPILSETVLNQSVLGVVDFVRKSVAE